MTTIIASGSSTLEEQQQVDDQAAQQDRQRQQYVAETPWREKAAVVAHMADGHIVAHIMVGAAGKGKRAVRLVSGVFPGRGGLRRLRFRGALPAAAVPAGPAVIAATMLAPM